MSVQRYEVLSGDVRRRSWPRALKEEVVLETLSEGTTVTEVARRRGIDRSLIYRWRRQMRVCRQDSDERFLPIHVSAPDREPSADGPADEEGGSPGRMVIALANGRRITVFSDVDADALSRVVAVLEGR